MLSSEPRKVIDAGGVELEVDDQGYIDAYTISPKDHEFIEEVLSDELRPMVEAFIRNLRKFSEQGL